MKILITLLCLIFTFALYAQYEPKLNDYKDFSIIKQKETINFHIYPKNNIANCTDILLYLQGYGSEPFFRIERSKSDSMATIYSSMPFDLDKIPKEYALVIVDKKCVPFLVEGEPLKTAKCFYEHEGLKNRVNQANEVLKYIIKNLIKKPKKVVVIGHSEGTDVVAKLGTINKQITHIGFWAGGGNTQFYDFPMFIRKEVLKGKITEEEAIGSMDTLMMQFKDIMAHENSVDKFWSGNSYKRWSSFSEPSIDNLLKINIPLYVAVGAKDESVPIESSYLIPMEFIRHKKTNLTFKVYPNYDHSFVNILEKGDEAYHWMDVFEEFMKRVDK